MEFIEIITKML